MQTTDILVPVDFSEQCRLGLRAANQWARMFAGRVTPMHGYEAITDLDGYHFFGPKGHVKGTLHAVQTEVVQLLHEFASADVDADLLAAGRCVAGAPAPAVIEAAATHDLVVLSSHGRSGVAHMLLGSVAARVVQGSPAPVLLVHQQPLPTQLRRVLVATDLSANSATALRTAGLLAARTGAGCEVLHVHSMRGDELVLLHELEARVRQFATASFAGLPQLPQAAEIRVLLCAGSVQDAMLHHVDGHPADLLVIATVGGDGHRPGLLGRTPGHLVRALQKPVLLVPPSSKRAAR